LAKGPEGTQQRKGPTRGLILGGGSAILPKEPGKPEGGKKKEPKTGKISASALKWDNKNATMVLQRKVGVAGGNAGWPSVTQKKTQSKEKNNQGPFQKRKMQQKAPGTMVQGGKIEELFQTGKTTQHCEATYRRSKRRGAGDPPRQKKMS